MSALEVVDLVLQDRQRRFFSVWYTVWNGEVTRVEWTQGTTHETKWAELPAREFSLR